MPERFVILFHEMPASSSRPSHWDLMFERRDALLTWALDEEPDTDREIAATQLASHRKDYLHYEGPVSQDRGIVTRWDRGEFTLERGEDDAFVALLEGQRLSEVRVALQRDHPNDQRWIVRFSRLARASI